MEPKTVPTTRSWPLVGDLPKLARGGMGYIDAQREALGDIYRIQAGPQAVVLLHHPDHVQHVLRTHVNNYVKQGTFWSAIRSLLGLGLPTAEGEPWRSRRRMMNPQFRNARIDALGAIMVQAIDEQLSSWPQQQEPFNVGHAVSQVTMAVLVRTLFGTGLDATQASVVTDALSFSLDHMMHKIVTDALPAWVPVPGRRGHREAVAQIDAVIYELIAKRRADEPGDDLLSMMLAMRDDENGRGLSDQELRDETMSLFLAGYETTATTVSWALARLARADTIRQALVDEIDTVLAGVNPTSQEVVKLDLTRRVFLETLHLDAPVFFLPRVAAEDDVIDGHRIEAGTMVSLMIDRVHRHPAFWPDPERFDPDRFLPEHESARHPCAFIPFGSGQRQCIGQHFAMMEGAFLLSMLLQRFRFTLPEGYEVQAQLAITKRPRDGLMMHVTRR